MQLTLKQEYRVVAETLNLGKSVKICASISEKLSAVKSVVQAMIGWSRAVDWRKTHQDEGAI